MERALQGCEVIFHCAYGNSGTPEARRLVNVQGTENVLAAALHAGIKRVVYLSTMMVYGETPDSDLDETAPYRYSGNAYADTKLDAEKIAFDYIKQHNLPDAVLHVRLRETYRGMYRQASAWARDYVWLHKKHDLLGAPGYKPRSSLSAWIKLLKKLPWAIRTKTDLARWIWQFGWFTGELQGMVRYQLLAP